MRAAKMRNGKESVSSKKLETRCLACTQELHPYAKGSKLVWCADCRYWRSTYKFDAKVYDKPYALKYMDLHTSKMSLKLNSFRTMMLLKHVKRDRFKQVFDFGCGTGSFARLASQDWDVSAYDINPDYYPFWRQFGGDRVKYLKVLEKEPNYDIVTCFDSLEHIEDIPGFVQFFRPTIFLISIPIFKTGDILKWRHYKPKEHLHYFTLKAFINFMNRMGYKVLEISNGETKIGRADIMTVAFRAKL